MSEFNTQAVRFFLLHFIAGIWKQFQNLGFFFSFLKPGLSGRFLSGYLFILWLRQESKKILIRVATLRD